MYALSFENIPRSVFFSVLFHALFFALASALISYEYLEISQSMEPKGILLEMGAFTAGASGATLPQKLSAKMVPAASEYYHKKDHPHPEAKKINTDNESLSQSTGTAASSAIGNSLTSSGAVGQVGDPNGVEASARERYMYELKLFLEQNKKYPNQARMLGQEGKVTVSFTVKKDGQILDVKLTEACPYSKLNEAAVKLIENIKQFKAFPEGVSHEQWTLNVPIQYSLN